VGAKEFSVGLNDFNQEQLDAIQLAVDDVQTAEGEINQSVVDVQTLVTALKNTDVAQVSAAMFENGVLTLSSVTLTGTESTVLDVTGKGCLLAITFPNTTVSNSQIKVAVDGGADLLILRVLQAVQTFMIPFSSRLIIKSLNGSLGGVGLLYVVR
jgi:hypothetical protein